MIRTILAALSTDDLGGDFEKSNVKNGGNTIDIWQNDMLQVRQTNPRNGPPGARVSILGKALGSLATEDGGFAKLQMHLNIRNALVEALPKDLEIHFSDKPNRKGESYPNIFINKAEATSSAVDTGTLTTEAIDAGVHMSVLRECVASSSWDRLRAEISLARAGVSTETTDEAPEDDVEDDTDADGDSSFPS